MHCCDERNQLCILKYAESKNKRRQALFCLVNAENEAPKGGIHCFQNCFIFPGDVLWNRTNALHDFHNYHGSTTIYFHFLIKLCS